MLPSGVTQAELDEMTEEERAALLDPETDETTVAEPDGEDELDGKDKPEPEADPEPEPEPKPADKPADKPEDKKKAEDEPDAPGRDDGDEPKQAPQVPLIRGEMPADIDAKRADIEKRMGELAEKFEDGDMTTKEFQAEQRKLNKEESDLDWAVRKAELAEETSKSQAEAMWYGAVGEFQGQNPEIWANATRTKVFDTIVMEVTAETMNAGRLPGMADLNKAYKRYCEDLGIPMKDAAKEQDPKPDPKPEPKAKEPRNVPPTLGKVPAADNTSVEAGVYDALNRLADTDPLKYQSKIDAMSEAERDTYFKYN